MKQPQYQPMPVWEQALTLFAVNNGYMEGIDLRQLGSFEKALRDHVRSKHADLVARLDASKDMSKDDEAELRAAIDAFKKTGSF